MSLQESRSTSRLLTQRWTKFGMDRLYVKTDDGLDVGWLDLVDGSRLVTKPQFAEAFNLTVESWLASRSQGCTSTLSNALAVDSAHVEETGIVEKPSVPRRTDRAQRAEQPWDDLALRVAGQSATEQADLLWIQGPEFRGFLSRLLRIRTKGIRTEEERVSTDTFCGASLTVTVLAITTSSGSTLTGRPDACESSLPARRASCSELRMYSTRVPLSRMVRPPTHTLERRWFLVFSVKTPPGPMTT
jgi:hypothetical protein